MKKGLKIFIVAMSLVLVIATAVGTTLALLTDRTATVKNTFTVGDVQITLTETTGNSYKLVPRAVITKDPKVTVEANSENCWLFVKIDKSTGLDTLFTVKVDAGWTALDGQTGVYYREVTSSTTAQDFFVITDNKITVKDVTSAVLQEAAKNEISLSFTAYACQKEGISTAAAAWDEVKDLPNP